MIKCCDNLLRYVLKAIYCIFLNFDTQLILNYELIIDIAVQREEAGKIAFAKGISQGLSQGSHRKALETARLMHQRAYPVAEICLMTGLTQAEVESICNG